MIPYVSIIVPCYGVEQYLNQCLNSLVNQTLENIEIILVDDESPDQVPKMCDDWALKDSRIKVIHKKNGGLGLARNSGLQVARGEFVAFVDSDDFVDISMYETLYNRANKEKADVCYCGYSYFDGKRIKDVQEGIVNEVVYCKRKEIDNFLFSMIGMPSSYGQDTLINMCVWRAIYRRAILLEKNILFVSERIAASEDVTFHSSFLPYASKVCFLPKHLYRYRYNPDSISHSYPNWKRNSLLENCVLVKRILEEHYSPSQYMMSYRRHLFRNLKTIIRKETFRNAPFMDRKTDILEILKNPVFLSLFDKKFHPERLILKQRIIYLLCKHQCASTLMFLNKLFR